MLHPISIITTMTASAQKLELYERAVQNPEAEAAFLERVYLQALLAPPASRTQDRTLLPEVTFRSRLREDFAGSAALAAAWVERGEDYRALAIERDSETVTWAQRQINERLDGRAQDVVLVESDVMDLLGPRVDVVCALNFSAMIYHDRDSLGRYLRHARRCLDGQGVVILDLFGGPGAKKIGTQSIRHDGFTYHWEQRAFDPAMQRIDCRIHFTLSDGAELRNAFVYDWRLWSPSEMLEIMAETGLEAQLWCDGWDATACQSDGVYHPVTRIEDERHDWIAYAIGVRR